MKDQTAAIAAAQEVYEAAFDALVTANIAAVDAARVAKNAFDACRVAKDTLGAARDAYNASKWVAGAHKIGKAADINPYTPGLTPVTWPIVHKDQRDKSDKK